MVDIKKLNKQMVDTGMNRTIGMQLSDGQKAMQENNKLKKRIEELEKALNQSPERVSVDAVVSGLVDEAKYEIVRKALYNVSETFRKRGWTEESKQLHSDICCDIMNAKE